MIAPSAIALRARPTRSSRKRAEHVGSPDASQGTMPICSRTPVLSQSGGEIDVKWRVDRGGGGGKRKALSRVLG